MDGGVVTGLCDNRLPGFYSRFLGYGQTVAAEDAAAGATPRAAGAAQVRPQESLDTRSRCPFEVAGPSDVAFLIEACLELAQGRDRLAGLGGLGNASRLIVLDVCLIELISVKKLSIFLQFFLFHKFCIGLF